MEELVIRYAPTNLRGVSVRGANRSDELEICQEGRPPVLGDIIEESISNEVEKARRGEHHIKDNG